MRYLVRQPKVLRVIQLARDEAKIHVQAIGLKTLPSLYRIV